MPVPLLTMVELPRLAPVLYDVPFAGDTDGDEDVDIRTVYPVTPPAAVKLPWILLEVTLEKTSDVGCAPGTVQLGSNVVLLPVSGLSVL